MDDAHRKEQANLRRKRKAAKENKSDKAREQERRRREHTKRILAKQGGTSKKVGSGKSSSHHKSSKSVLDKTSSSEFQKLFEKRAEGFVIDLKFRNAPPRPPVGPFFVGCGFEDEMERRWTQYRPNNSIELNHSLQLHDERSLITTCAFLPCMLDEGEYYPKTAVKKGKDGSGAEADLEPAMLDEADEKLLNWTGSLGDTAADELKKRRELAHYRANGLLGAGQGSATPKSKLNMKIELANKSKNKGSRVLAEKHQRWMKKTTYLTNDQSKSVHQFKSQADYKKQSKEEIELQLRALKEKVGDKQFIEKSFDAVNKGPRPRGHPTKRGVTVVSDVPIFPDIFTWGLSYSNVVIDNLPQGITVTPEQLSSAVIGDVGRKGGDNSKKMECNLLVQPEKDDSKQESSESSDSPIYKAVQKYNLDVFPLRSDDQPDINYLFFYDKEKKVVTYHPIQSRVQLSTGHLVRGVAPMSIRKRELTSEEKLELDERAAAIDLELSFSLRNGIDEHEG